MGLTLTGCWDQRSVTNRGVAVGLEVSPTSKPGLFAWTYLFPNVTVTVSSLPSIKPREQYFSETVTAASLAQSQTLVQQKLSRDLYMGQLKVVVWSSTMTTEHVITLLNTLNHEGLIPKTYWVVTGPPPLAKLLTPSPQEVVPQLYLSRMFDCLKCQPFNLGRHGWQFWADTVTPGISPNAPYASGPTHINELAVYGHGRHGRPYIFNAEQTQGWAYLTARADKGTLTLFTRPGVATISRVHGSRSMKVQLVRGTLQVKETLRLTALLSQIPSGVALDHQYLLRVQRLGEQAVLARCLAAIRVADSTHTDPFGYARTLLWTNSQTTRRMPLDQLVSLPIHATITVRLKIVGQGVSV